MVTRCILHVSIQPWYLFCIFSNVFTPVAVALSVPKNTNEKTEKAIFCFYRVNVCHRFYFHVLLKRLNLRQVYATALYMLCAGIIQSALASLCLLIYKRLALYIINTPLKRANFRGTMHLVRARFSITPLFFRKEHIVVCSVLLFVFDSNVSSKAITTNARCWLERDARLPTVYVFDCMVLNKKEEIKTKVVETSMHRGRCVV